MKLFKKMGDNAQKILNINGDGGNDNTKDICEEKVLDDLKKELNILPFDKLNTSTISAMVYSNITVDLLKFFCSVPITYVDPPLTKKKKKIDRKKIKADYGAIFSVQYGIYFRGIKMSGSKRYWCPRCQKYNSKGKKELTVDEEEHQINNEERKIYPLDTKKIMFYCRLCDKYLSANVLRKIIPFLNQVTIVLSLEKNNINIMMFKVNFKLAGNKSFNDAVETIEILWEDYIRPSISLWKHTDEVAEKKSVNFCFDLTMRNVDFRVGFPIDKCRLNDLMNMDEYKNVIQLSQYETTSATHVNIRMNVTNPNNTYNVLVYDNPYSNPIFMKSKDKLYANKIKKKKEEGVTFIAFSSSETILTGKSYKNMKDSYDFYIKTVLLNKDFIEEKVRKPKISIKDYLILLKDNAGKADNAGKTGNTIINKLIKPLAMINNFVKPPF